MLRLTPAGAGAGEFDAGIVAAGDCSAMFSNRALLASGAELGSIVRLLPTELGAELGRLVKLIQA